MKFWSVSRCDLRKVRVLVPLLPREFKYHSNDSIEVVNLIKVVTKRKCIPESCKF